MLRATCLLIPLFLAAATTGIGQEATFLKGSVFLAEDDTPVPGATVVNLSSNKMTTAATDGSYSIEAGSGDMIYFSATGMVRDSVKVEEELLRSGYDAGLNRDPSLLKSVTVISSYQLDSLSRREMYAAYFEKKQDIRGGNRPNEGFGVSVSPVTHFSKKKKEERKFRKQLLRNEEEAYIDYVFSPMWVSKLTGLKGEPLRDFIYRYRPDYKMARATDRPNMIAYINEKLIEYRKRQQ